MDYSGKDSRQWGINDKVTARLKTFSQESNISLEISRLKLYESPLKSRYNVQKYDIASNYVLPDKAAELIPKGTPEYVDEGEKYVERIMRALFYFKQCALIGP